jgi:hypothetical protein
VRYFEPEHPPRRRTRGQSTRVECTTLKGRWTRLSLISKAIAATRLVSSRICLRTSAEYCSQTCSGNLSNSASNDLVLSRLLVGLK